MIARGGLTILMLVSSIIIIILSLLPAADNTLFIGRYCKQLCEMIRYLWSYFQLSTGWCQPRQVPCHGPHITDWTPSTRGWIGQSISQFNASIRIILTFHCLDCQQPTQTKYGFTWLEKLTREGKWELCELEKGNFSSCPQDLLLTKIGLQFAFAWLASVFVAKIRWILNINCLSFSVDVNCQHHIKAENRLRIPIYRQNFWHEKTHLFQHVNGAARNQICEQRAFLFPSCYVVMLAYFMHSLTIIACRNRRRRQGGSKPAIFIEGGKSHHQLIINSNYNSNVSFLLTVWKPDRLVWISYRNRHMWLIRLDDNILVILCPTFLIVPGLR